jgi:hypothetical protein
LRHKLPDILASYFGVEYRDEVPDSIWKSPVGYYGGIDIDFDKVRAIINRQYIFDREIELMERLQNEL